MARHDKSEMTGIAITEIVNLISEARASHGKRWRHVRRRVQNEIFNRSRLRRVSPLEAMRALACESPTPAGAATVAAAFFDRS